MAAVNRERYTEMSGHDHAHATDAELLDAFTYNVFPNFAPVGRVHAQHRLPLAARGPIRTIR